MPDGSESKIGEGSNDVILRPVLTEETAKQLIELGLRNKSDEVVGLVSDAVVNILRGRGAIGLHDRLVEQTLSYVELGIGSEQERAIHVKTVEAFKRQVNKIIRTVLAQNEQIRKLEEENRESRKDKLTGLYNRRGFDEIVPESIGIGLSASPEAPNEVSFLFMDIDKFKDFNDNYGHRHGDKVLKGVAGVIAETASRESDFVCRLGGEEFVVVLFGCSQKYALKKAEEIRAAVENAEFAFEGENHKVTISIGASSMSLHEEVEKDAETTTEELLLTADTLMYQSKETGRNRVTGEANLDSEIFEKKRQEAAANRGNPDDASEDLASESGVGSETA